MSVSSVGSSNPYSYLQWPQTDGSDSTDQSGAPTDPLQALFQSFSGGGGSSSDPLLAAIGQDDSSSSLPNFQFSPDMMQQLFSVQGDQSQASSSSSQSGLQSLLGQFDANGDGQISQSEFENAIGPDADKSKVDALFNKIDSNGDGSISSDEMKSAAQKAHGGGHHHHHAGGAGGSGGGDPLEGLLSGASADGTTSQSTTNPDGSTTTTLTYADGTTIDMTTPAAASTNASSANSASTNPEAPNFANLLKQLISLQAQLAAPTTNLSV
jgi:hypothetical protein